MSDAVPSTVSTKRRLFDLAVVLALTVGPSILASATAALFPRNYSHDLLAIQQAQAILLYGGCVALMCYVVISQGRRLADLGLTLKWTDVPASLLLFGIWVGMHYAYPFVRLYFWSGGVMNMNAEVRSLVTNEVTPLLVFTYLVSAAYEELIVRAYFMTEIMEMVRVRFLGPLLAIALSVALQVVYHSYQGSYSLGFHVAGFLPAAIFFALTRRAVPVVVGHALCNVWLVWMGGRF